MFVTSLIARAPAPARLIALLLVPLKPIEAATTTASMSDVELALTLTSSAKLATSASVDDGSRLVVNRVMCHRCADRTRNRRTVSG